MYLITSTYISRDSLLVLSYYLNSELIHASVPFNTPFYNPLPIPTPRSSLLSIIITTHSIVCASPIILPGTIHLGAPPLNNYFYF